MSYKAENLPTDKHCFFDAKGGVSIGKYASLNTNLSSADNKDNIMQNFDIIANNLNTRINKMFTVRQSVSNVAVFASQPSWFSIAADGIVTDNPDILIGIKTADCTPILLADYQHGIIGAAHAGWRGAYRGIIENVVNLMLQHGAVKKDIAAAIGPCLQQESFEVQNDMRQVLLNISKDNKKYFEHKNTGYFFDLSSYVEDKIHNLGIENVENSRIDTYPPENGYFSYRRYTHLGLITAPKDYPTQYSFIKL